MLPVQCLPAWHLAVQSTSATHSAQHCTVSQLYCSLLNSCHPAPRLSGILPEDQHLGLLERLLWSLLLRAGLCRYSVMMACALLIICAANMLLPEICFQARPLDIYFCAPPWVLVFSEFKGFFSVAILLSSEIIRFFMNNTDFFSGLVNNKNNEAEKKNLPTMYTSIQSSVLTT